MAKFKSDFSWIDTTKVTTPSISTQYKANNAISKTYSEISSTPRYTGFTEAQTDNYIANKFLESVRNDEQEFNYILSRYANLYNGANPNSYKKQLELARELNAIFPQYSTDYFMDNAKTFMHAATGADMDIDSYSEHLGAIWKSTWNNVENSGKMLALYLTNRTEWGTEVFQLKKKKVFEEMRKNSSAYNKAHYDNTYDGIFQKMLSGTLQQSPNIAMNLAISVSTAGLGYVLSSAMKAVGASAKAIAAVTTGMKGLRIAGELGSAFVMEGGSIITEMAQMGFDDDLIMSVGLLAAIASSAIEVFSDETIFRPINSLTEYLLKNNGAEIVKSGFKVFKDSLVQFGASMITEPGEEFFQGVIQNFGYGIANEIERMRGVTIEDLIGYSKEEVADSAWGVIKNLTPYLKKGAEEGYEALKESLWSTPLMTLGPMITGTVGSTIFGPISQSVKGAKNFNIKNAKFTINKDNIIMSSVEGINTNGIKLEGKVEPVQAIRLGNKYIIRGATPEQAAAIKNSSVVLASEINNLSFEDKYKKYDKNPTKKNNKGLNLLKDDTLTTTIDTTITSAMAEDILVSAYNNYQLESYSYLLANGTLSDYNDGTATALIVESTESPMLTPYVINISDKTNGLTKEDILANRLSMLSAYEKIFGTKVKATDNLYTKYFTGENTQSTYGEDANQKKADAKSEKKRKEERRQQQEDAKKKRQEEAKQKAQEEQIQTEQSEQEKPSSSEIEQRIIDNKGKDATVDSLEFAAIDEERIEAQEKVAQDGETAKTTEATPTQETQTEQTSEQTAETKTEPTVEPVKEAPAETVKETPQEALTRRVKEKISATDKGDNSKVVQSFDNFVKKTKNWDKKGKDSRFGGYSFRDAMGDLSDSENGVYLVVESAKGTTETVFNIADWSKQDIEIAENYLKGDARLLRERLSSEKQASVAEAMKNVGVKDTPKDTTTYKEAKTVKQKEETKSETVTEKQAEEVKTEPKAEAKVEPVVEPKTETVVEPKKEEVEKKPKVIRIKKTTTENAKADDKKTVSKNSETTKTADTQEVTRKPYKEVTMDDIRNAYLDIATNNQKASAENIYNTLLVSKVVASVINEDFFDVVNKLKKDILLSIDGSKPIVDETDSIVNFIYKSLSDRPDFIKEMFGEGSKLSTAKNRIRNNFVNVVSDYINFGTNKTGSSESALNAFKVLAEELYKMNKDKITQKEFEAFNIAITNELSGVNNQIIAEEVVQESIESKTKPSVIKVETPITEENVANTNLGTREKLYDGTFTEAQLKELYKTKYTENLVKLTAKNTLATVREAMAEDTKGKIPIPIVYVVNRINTLKAKIETMAKKKGGIFDILPQGKEYTKDDYPKDTLKFIQSLSELATLDTIRNYLSAKDTARDAAREIDSLIDNEVRVSDAIFDGKNLAYTPYLQVLGKIQNDTNRNYDTAKYVEIINKAQANNSDNTISLEAARAMGLAEDDSTRYSSERITESEADAFVRSEVEKYNRDGTILTKEDFDGLYGSTLSNEKYNRYLNEIFGNEEGIDTSRYNLKEDLSVSESARAEMQEVYNRYYGTDEWMKAPNGNLSNLTERQWLQVRTDSFKNWFGDWENNPQNASKMVDDNGEPKVFYHYTNNAFSSYAETFRENRDKVIPIYDRQLNALKGIIEDLQRILPEFENNPNVDELYKDLLLKPYKDNNESLYNSDITDTVLYYFKQILRGESAEEVILYNIESEYKRQMRSKFASYAYIELIKQFKEEVKDILSNHKEIILTKDETKLVKDFLNSINDVYKYSSKAITEIGSEKYGRNSTSRPSANDIYKWLNHPEFLVTSEENYINVLLDVELTQLERFTIPFHKTDEGWLGEGYYFAENQINSVGLGNFRYEMFLNARHPLIANDGTKYGGIYDENGNGYSIISTNAETNPNSKAFRERYDAVYAKGNASTMTGTNEVVVFTPNQIKSATENNGAFSTTDNSFRYSEEFIDVNDNLTELDKEYFDAIESGNLERARILVASRAKELGFDNVVPEMMPSYKVRVKKAPTKTIKAYKTFFVDSQGMPSALFVNGTSPLPMGVFLDATEGWYFVAENGKKYVPSTKNPNSEGNETGSAIKIPNDEVRTELINRGFLPKGSKAQTVTALAYRPGWHGGDLPFFPQGGVLGNRDDGKNARFYNPNFPMSNYANIHRWNQVVFEVEFNNEKDYTRTKLTEDGKTKYLDMQEMPLDGGYKFATNPMTNSSDLGTWLISDSMKIVRALSEEECNAILSENGFAPQEWEMFEETKKGRKGLGKHYMGHMNLETLGYTGPTNDAARKTLAPITYDDNGNIIPLSQRFNSESSDIRYSKDGIVYGDSISNSLNNSYIADIKGKDLINVNAETGLYTYNKDALQAHIESISRQEGATAEQVNSVKFAGLYISSLDSTVQDAMIRHNIAMNGSVDIEDMTVEQMYGGTESAPSHLKDSLGWRTGAIRGALLIDSARIILNRTATLGDIVHENYHLAIRADKTVRNNIIDAFKAISQSTEKVESLRKVISDNLFMFDRFRSDNMTDEQLINLVTDTLVTTDENNFFNQTREEFATRLYETWVGVKSKQEFDSGLASVFSKIWEALKKIYKQIKGETIFPDELDAAYSLFFNKSNSNREQVETVSLGSPIVLSSVRSMVADKVPNKLNYNDAISTWSDRVIDDINEDDFSMIRYKFERALNGKLYNPDKDYEIMNNLLTEYGLDEQILKAAGGEEDFRILKNAVVEKMMAYFESIPVMANRLYELTDKLVTSVGPKGGKKFVSKDSPEFKAFKEFFYSPVPVERTDLYTTRPKSLFDVMREPEKGIISRLKYYARLANTSGKAESYAEMLGAVKPNDSKKRTLYTEALEAAIAVHGEKKVNSLRDISALINPTLDGFAEDATVKELYDIVNTLFLVGDNALGWVNDASKLKVMNRAGAYTKAGTYFDGYLARILYATHVDRETDSDGKFKLTTTPFLDANDNYVKTSNKMIYEQYQWQRQNNEPYPAGLIPSNDSFELGPYMYNEALVELIGYIRDKTEDGLPVVSPDETTVGYLNRIIETFHEKLEDLRESKKDLAILDKATAKTENEVSKMEALNTRLAELTEKIANAKDGEDITPLKDNLIQVLNNVLAVTMESMSEKDAEIEALTDKLADADKNSKASREVASLKAKLEKVQNANEELKKEIKENRNIKEFLKTLNDPSATTENITASMAKADDTFKRMVAENKKLVKTINELREANKKQQEQVTVEIQSQESNSAVKTVEEQKALLESAIRELENIPRQTRAQSYASRQIKVLLRSFKKASKENKRKTKKTDKAPAKEVVTINLKHALFDLYDNLFYNLDHNGNKVAIGKSEKTAPILQFLQEHKMFKFLRDENGNLKTDKNGNRTYEVEVLRSYKDLTVDELAELGGLLKELQQEEMDIRKTYQNKVLKEELITDTDNIVKDFISYGENKKNGREESFVDYQKNLAVTGKQFEIEKQGGKLSNLIADFELLAPKIRDRFPTLYKVLYGGLNYDGTRYKKDLNTLTNGKQNMIMTRTNRFFGKVADILNNNDIPAKHGLAAIFDKSKGEWTGENVRKSYNRIFNLDNFNIGNTSISELSMMAKENGDSVFYQITENGIIEPENFRPEMKGIANYIKSLNEKKAKMEKRIENAQKKISKIEENAKIRELTEQEEENLAIFTTTRDNAIQILSSINTQLKGDIGREHANENVNYSAQQLIGIYLLAQQKGGLFKLIEDYGIVKDKDGNITITHKGGIQTANLTLNNVLDVMAKMMYDEDYAWLREIADAMQEEISSRKEVIGDVFWRVTGRMMDEEYRYFRELPDDGTVRYIEDVSIDGMEQMLSRQVEDGFTESRIVGSKYRPSLYAADNFLNAINNQEHYIYFAEKVSDLRKMIKTEYEVGTNKTSRSRFIDSIMYAMGEKDGNVFIRQLSNLVDEIAGKPPVEKAGSTMRNWMQEIRGNFAVGALWGSITATLQQIPTVLYAAVDVGMPTLIRAMNDYFRNNVYYVMENENAVEAELLERKADLNSRNRTDLTIGEFEVEKMKDFIYKYSSQIKYRSSEQRSYINSKRYNLGIGEGKNLLGIGRLKVENNSQLEGAREAGRTFVDAGMSMMEGADKMIANITWLAYYYQALDNYEQTAEYREHRLTELEKREYCANEATQRTLDITPSQNEKDTAEIYRSRDNLTRSMLLFTKQINQMANKTYRGFEALKAGEMTPKKFATLVGYVAAVSLLNALIAAKIFPKVGDDDDDDESYFIHFTKEFAKQALENNIPVLGNAISQVIDGTVYYESDDIIANAIGILSETAKAAKREELNSSKLGNAAWNLLVNTSNKIMPIPVNAANKMRRAINKRNIAYLYNTALGDRLGGDLSD